jgi:hypothetical protein
MAKKEKDADAATKVRVLVARGVRWAAKANVDDVIELSSDADVREHAAQSSVDAGPRRGRTPNRSRWFLEEKA